MLFLDIEAVAEQN